MKNKSFLKDKYTKGNLVFHPWYMGTHSNDPQKFYNSSDFRKIKNRNRKNKRK